MFKHSKAPDCKYEQSCKRKLCQDESRDTKNNKEQMVDKENVNTNDGINVENVDNDFDLDSDSEQEDIDCEDCGKVFNYFDKMIEHRGIGNCAYFLDPCNKTFRYEDDMKKHIEKHCTNCGEEFSSINVLKVHKTNCKGFS